MSMKEPVAGRVERKKEVTRQKIITVAMELFKRQGLDATTMEQIAREVDIAKGTLYNYFPVKEAIISEYMQRSFGKKNSGRIRELRRIPDTRSRMTLIFGELIEGIQANREIFEKYMVYRMQSIISFSQEDSDKSGLYMLTTEIVELGQKSGEIRSDLPFDVLKDLLEFAFIEAVKMFYLEPERFRAREAVEWCVDLFMNGAGARVD